MGVNHLSWRVKAGWMWCDVKDKSFNCISVCVPVSSFQLLLIFPGMFSLGLNLCSLSISIVKVLGKSWGQVLSKPQLVIIWSRNGVENLRAIHYLLNNLTSFSCMLKAPRWLLVRTVVLFSLNLAWMVSVLCALPVIPITHVGASNRTSFLFFPPADRLPAPSRTAAGRSWSGGTHSFLRDGSNIST